WPATERAGSCRLRRHRRRRWPGRTRRPIPRHHPRTTPGEPAVNIVALILYAIFAVVGFGWRTWVQWRRTGDTGLRLHADPGSVAWWAKLAFIAAIAAGVAAPIAGLAGLDPLTLLDRPALRTRGVVVALAGIAAPAIAQLQMGTSWRLGDFAHERPVPVTPP